MGFTIEEDYNSLTAEEKELVHQLFNKCSTEKEFIDELNKLKKVVFKVIPPSGAEFLDHKNGFISYHTEKAIYPYIKQDFINIVDKKQDPYNIISLYGSIRTGKSTLVRLLILYVIVYVNYLRDPHLYFKITNMNTITIYLLSFKDDKTNELLLDPILKMIRTSDKFRKETFEKSVYEKGTREDGIIHYSTASKFGDITFPNCSVVTGRDPSDLIGGDIITGAITEITFYRKYIGLTDSEVTDVYAKLKTRIKNTIGTKIFPCFTILDSSAYDADSEIEKLINDKLKGLPECYYRYYRLWRVRPHLYEEYNKDRTKTFKVCTGNNTYPARIIRHESELKDIPTNLIVDVPIDLKDEFETKLTDSIRDLVGVGTSNVAKFIPSTKLIDRIFDNKLLVNYNTRLIVDSAESPVNLIWSKLDVDRIFTLRGLNYEVIRAPREPRFIGGDFSFSHDGDDSGLAVVHKEYSRVRKAIVYVVDFTLCIAPGENKINIDAICDFMIDLSYKGHLVVLGISFDTFQSETTVQKLERARMEVSKNSVDRTPEAYEMLGAILLQDCLKAGYNEYLYNNLNSLYRNETSKGKIKIDHSKSEVSIMGKDAKDISDAVCQAVWAAVQSPVHPSVIYEDENERLVNTLDEEPSEEKAQLILKRFR